MFRITQQSASAWSGMLEFIGMVFVTRYKFEREELAREVLAMQAYHSLVDRQLIRKSDNSPDDTNGSNLLQRSTTLPRSKVERLQNT